MRRIVLLQGTYQAEITVKIDQRRFDPWLICDLNNSAAVSDELLRGHIPLGVIGLPADDFKVRDRLCCDVINGRQHGETPLVGSAFSLGILIFVLA